MLTEFEESTGIKVNLKIHDGSDEEMIALMQTSSPGTFDVITPTSAYIPQAIEDGIIAELNPTDFPLDDYFNIIAEWPPVWKSGKLYAVVNRFGYYGITYNYKKFSESAVSSYDVLFDPAVKGRVALFDWFLPNMGCLSKYNGNENPYDLNASEFSALGDTLMKLRPQVGLVGNTSQVIQAMAGGSYDLAIAGEWVQAGMYDDGLPFKAGYKRYRIKTVEGVDDFKSIHEVVLRRFSRLLREGTSLPDIFLIDGGKGQLSAALDALNSLGVVPPCILSIAKREEEIFLPGKSEPLRLSRDAYSLRLLEYVRDEAHRFAQHYHHLLRGKRTLADDT